MVFLFNHEINENISTTKVSTISICACIDSCFCRDSRAILDTFNVKGRSNDKGYISDQEKRAIKGVLLWNILFNY